MKCADYFWMRSAGFGVEHVLPRHLFNQDDNWLNLLRLYKHREQLRVFFNSNIGTVGEENCRKFLRKVNENSLIQISDLPLVLREKLTQSIAEWRDVLESIQTSITTLRPYFNDYSENVRQSLKQFVAMPDVAEAIFISNPEAAQRIKSLLIEFEDGSGKGNRTRQKVRTAWSYAQRFCTKNDTCSFFGPISWGHFAEEQVELAAVECPPGSWLAQRKTFFESWVLQRIVAKVNSQCPTPENLPLSFNPACYLQGEVLHYPLNKSRLLEGNILKILQLLSQSSRSEIQLNNALDFSCNNTVEHLLSSRIIRRGFELSPRDENAFATLLLSMRAAQLPDSFVSEWQDWFRTLAEHRERYAQGDLIQRQEALAQINDALIRMGISLEREAGSMYVGRYPVYEDCSRASIVTFSKELQSRLNADFAPLGRLYQWLTRATAFLLHKACVDIFLACQQRFNRHEDQNEGGVSLLAFMGILSGSLEEIQTNIAQKIQDVFEVSWRPLLARNQSDELHLTKAELDQVHSALHSALPEAEQFIVFGDGFFSPDFMLAANSLEALNQGKYWVVLGETHPGVHTLSQPVAAPFCPFVSEIEKDVHDLFERQRIFLADSPESFQRSHIDWPLIARYSQLVLPSGGACVHPDRRHAVGRAYVHMRNNRLTVEDVEGAFQEDLLCVAGTALHQLLFRLASDVLPRFDSRRIYYKQTIYKRRTWVFAAGSWPEFSTDELDAFIQWTQWKVLHDLPRWIFVKCDSEPKPLYLDFENPLSLDMVASALKKAKLAHVSEMLPSPDDLWLTDSRGKVCCEIRTTFSSSRKLS